MISLTMNKNDLLKTIADMAYNVGFGAKRNFATFDIITKYPEYVSIISFVVGILGLVWCYFTTIYMSVVLLIISFFSFAVSKFDENPSKYDEEGIRETGLFNRLKSLYMEVKGLGDIDDTSKYSKELSMIESEFYKSTISNQIWFSNWYAHYKFFCEMNIGWIDEQLHFKLWKNKIPGTLKALIVLCVITVAIYVGYILHLNYINF